MYTVLLRHRAVIVKNEAQGNTEESFLLDSPSAPFVANVDGGSCTIIINTFIIFTVSL